MNQTLIKNINIWTMDERDSRFFGWILLENGKIASMGEGEPPAMPVQIDGDVVYGEGGVLTPGLIDIHSHIGLYEDGLGFEGADGNEDTDPATPHLRALDGVNPFDRSFREALEAGVTAAAVSPGSANPIGGQIALLKTAGRRVDDMILKAPLAIKFALGENPKSVYHDKDETPVTRMATAGSCTRRRSISRERRVRRTTRTRTSRISTSRWKRCSRFSGARPRHIFTRTVRTISLPRCVSRKSSVCGRLSFTARRRTLWPTCWPRSTFRWSAART